VSQLVQVSDVLRSSQKLFEQQNNYGLSAVSECLFAKQQILRNDYALKAAQQKPDSLKAAIMNVAAIGISLNPATAHAYLVPRDGAICLDISYRGLVKLATDAGAIEWAKAVLVYEGDTFEWNGPAAPPTHKADVFSSDRIDAADPLKNLKGGYCLAKLTTGDYMVEIMTAGEIQEVRDSSKAKNGPWSGKWAGEMAKKTLVKRASKSWPQSSGRDRIDTAIHVLNQHEGIEEAEQVDEEKVTEFLNILATGTSVQLLAFMADASDELQTTCFNTAPQGEKMKLKQRVRDKISEANNLIADYCTQITEQAESGDPSALALYEELDNLERRFVDGRLTDITHRQLESLREDAA
jgi:phage RecT family recombinase